MVSLEEASVLKKENREGNSICQYIYNTVDVDGVAKQINLSPPWLHLHIHPRPTLQALFYQWQLSHKLYSKLYWLWHWVRNGTEEKKVASHIRNFPCNSTILMFSWAGIGLPALATSISKCATRHFLNLFRSYQCWYKIVYQIASNRSTPDPAGTNKAGGDGKSLDQWRPPRYLF